MLRNDCASASIPSKTETVGLHSMDIFGHVTNSGQLGVVIFISDHLKCTGAVRDEG